MSPAPTMLVIHHVPHEGLGTFEEPLKESGHKLRFLKVYEPEANWSECEQIDALVVMGGPMAVYEKHKHPFITKELKLIERVLKAEQPILGICLGAQLLAYVLGARVRKNSQKEIGWYPLMREPGADGDPLCEPFGQTETVFQWHGDTFALPKGAARLFSSPLCSEQAFRYSDAVYGLQFHVEVTEAMIGAWLRINRSEISTLHGVIDPSAIRRQIPQHTPRLAELSRHIALTFGRSVSARFSTESREVRN